MDGGDNVGKGLVDLPRLCRSPHRRVQGCALDTPLANACLDYLSYERLGITEVHEHLPGGEKALHRWRADYGLTPPRAGR